MGSWISNISIRKNGNISMDDVAGYLSQMASERQYEPAASEEEADGAFAIIADENAQWFTICSDLISLEDPELFPEIATPMSARLHTDVLGIACFDSDYLYLNLINAEDQTDAWIGIGSAAGLGIKRRSGLKAWKKKVADFPAFSACAKQAYICTEEFLVDAEPCLGLPTLQSAASFEYLKDPERKEKTTYYYFKQRDDAQDRKSAQFALYCMHVGLPCLVERESDVSVISEGPESKGLSIYFLGPYVEKDEITFSNVRLGNWRAFAPIELTKEQLPDGQWAYAYHDPEFKIPPMVPNRLRKEKRAHLEMEQHITVRFVPHGNSRQTLDITVVFVPDQNPSGQASWTVWHPWGSKKAFIEFHNKLWKRVRAIEERPENCLPFLREEDFD
ncbi:MAG: hypothetical protein PUB93_00345 [Firmicutes bacterium]|nr:hypothetical protein [Bacillota bacterium]